MWARVSAGTLPVSARDQEPSALFLRQRCIYACCMFPHKKVSIPFSKNEMAKQTQCAVGFCAGVGKTLTGNSESDVAE